MTNSMVGTSIQENTLFICSLASIFFMLKDRNILEENVSEHTEIYYEHDMLQRIAGQSYFSHPMQYSFLIQLLSSINVSLTDQQQQQLRLSYNKLESTIRILTGMFP